MNTDEVTYLKTCCGCDSYHGYWFGKTCGACGHDTQFDCDHKGGK